MRRVLPVVALAACADPTPGLDDRGDVAAGGVDRPILIYGHRGAPWSAIENTLEAYAAALHEGANAIELDVCVTADGEAVLWHDATPDDANALARQAGLERLPYLPWVPGIGSRWRRPVAELTLSELREHYDYQERRGLLGDVIGVGERAGAHLPTFEEFAAWARTPEAVGLAGLYVDVKVTEDRLDLAEVLAARVADATAGAPYRVLIASPRRSVVNAMRSWFRDHRPDASVAFAWDHESSGALEDTVAGGYDVIALGLTPLRRWRTVLREVEEAAADPRDVLVWTIDDDARMEQLLDREVDAIVTNRPADLARHVERGWADHDRAIEAITRCFAAHHDRADVVPCTTAGALGLRAPLRRGPLVSRACASRADAAARDAFGCGLLDALDVRFDVELGPRADVAIAWDGEAGEVAITD
jgi:glycerophosphoryl diester phosphodiesterase